MLLRSSALIYPGLHLVTLGNTCRYLVTGEADVAVLTDPGCSAHVAFLPERLSLLGTSVQDITSVAITHCDADRIAGIPLLRRHVPRLQVVGSAQMVSILANEDTVRKLWEEDRSLSELLLLKDAVPEMSFDEFRAGLRIDKHLVDSDTISVDEDTMIRLVLTPGHRKHSVSYLILPHEFILTDETFGYYQGRRLAAPGGDFDLESALNSIKKFNHIDVSGIGFPYTGAITGEIVRKHLEAISVNTMDLIDETKRAIAEGVPMDEIKTQIRESFFLTSLRDPCVLRSLDATFEAAWLQLNRAAGSAAEG